MPLIRIVILLLSLYVATTACTPGIGDSCASSSECPRNATCDTTASGGYCIIFDCPDFGCPDESVCIDFPTFNACMRYCEVNDDCRTEDGMICRTDNGPVGYCYHPEQEP